MPHALASSSGLIGAFVFFLLLSAGVAFMLYALLTQPSARRLELGLGTVRTAIAAPLAFAIGTAIFSGIYVSSLAGFHAVVVGDDDIRIAYAVPFSRSVVLSYPDIVDVASRPAYKLLWRLEIHMRTGERFRSVPGASRQVTAAVDAIERRRRL